MRLLVVLLSGLLVCGCIYDVPLTEDAVVPIDPALPGIWQEIPDEGKAEDSGDRLVILPFSETEYIAVLSPGDDALYFRAYPVRLEDMELIQAEWLALETDKKDISPYLVCRFNCTNDLLTIEYLNPDVVDSDSKDSALLREAVLANRSNPDLFGDPARYRRLKD